MTMNLWVPPAVLQNLLSSVLWARSLLAAHWNGPVAEGGQAENSLEVFSDGSLTLSESWPPLADRTMNDRT